jgi:hypothetical protein
MPEYNFQLRGWHALLAIPVLALYLLVTMMAHVRSVDDAMRDAVRQHLLNEYSGRGPKDVARILAEAHDGAPVESLPPEVQRDVEFPSFAAHGKMDGRVVYVRVTITVDGAAPPDGRSIRYLTLSSRLGGWNVTSESSAYIYYNELLP